MRCLLPLCILALLCTYIGFSQETLGAGHYPGVTVMTSDQQPTAPGHTTLDGNGLLPNLNASSRFLAQATLGAAYESILSTAEKGFSQWLDEQIAMPVSMSMQAETEKFYQRHRDSLQLNGGDPADAQYYSDYWRYAWWQHVMTPPDVLRARVALALSEIFVLSEIPDLGSKPLGLASYYDVLVENALGNFRTLLYEVTLHPCMGVYLTHINNPKSDWERNTYPDENYAREVMQLFTIGLYELNLDGTRKVDDNGNFIPTYSHDDISEFAKVFTGLSWADSDRFGKNAPSDTSYTQPMIMYNGHHEPGAKWLLNGFIVPNRNPPDGIADINNAIDNLFSHPNVGPFIAKRLIQRLVTSNPSPGYIERVAKKFNDNGQGIRGDMAAVVKAILLDQEARDCSLAGDPNYGMLREPMVRYTQIARAFNAKSEEDFYRNRMQRFYEDTEQRPLASPSVFNFFQPDFQPIGEIEQADKVAPEFQITNALTTIGYANQVHDWVFDEKLMQYGSVFQGEEFSQAKEAFPDLSDEKQLLQDEKYDELLERLNLILMHGRMSEATRSAILDAIMQLPEDQKAMRLPMALFLVMVSPDYLILR